MKSSGKSQNPINDERESNELWFSRYRKLRILYVFVLLVLLITAWMTKNEGGFISVLFFALGERVISFADGRSQRSKDQQTEHAQKDLNA